MAQDRWTYSLIFAVLGALFFLPFLGEVHLFDWDEINFAEISREMIVTGEYSRIFVNFEPFWEKPPFFFWMQVLAMKIFGIGEYAARFPNAICGILTLVLLFQMGRKIYNTPFGVIWAGVYLGTILPHLYFKSGIIDPFFNLFIFLGLYFFILFYWKKENLRGIVLPKSKWTYLFLSGFVIGMAILTKGQVAYLICCLTFFVYWVYQRFRMYVSIPQFLFFTFATTLVTLSWYGVETWKNGPWFITTFNEYQIRLLSTPDACHKGFIGYHFVVLLVGCFPASIFAIRSFFKMPPSKHHYQKDFRLWMKILFWVVLILFSIVQSKIVHYSSMCYFPLTFLASISIYEIITRRITFNRRMKTALWFIGSLFIIAILAAPYLAQHPELIFEYIQDPFARENLKANHKWGLGFYIPGIFLWFVLILTMFFAKKNNYERAFTSLFLGTALFVTVTLVFFINRIESYSQNAAVEFVKSKAKEDCYIIPWRYKSYVQLFYAQKPKVENQKSYDREWCLKGNVDKDVYLISKIHKLEGLSNYPELKEIDRKDGFVFFKRIRPE